MECRSNSSGHNFPVARLLIAALLLRHQPAHKVISVATYSADLEPGKQTLGCIGNFRLPREALFASRQSSSTSSTIRTSEIQTTSSPALYLAARRKHCRTAWDQVAQTGGSTLFIRLEGRVPSSLR